MTCVGQDYNEGVSSAVKREITQGLLEGHGADKGVIIAGTSCCFYDFETTTTIEEAKSSVRFLV